MAVTPVPTTTKSGNTIEYILTKNQANLPVEIVNKFRQQDGREVWTVNTGKAIMNVFPDVDLSPIHPKLANKIATSNAKIQINKVSGDEFATALPFIGKTTAKKIITSKPEGGYMGIGHVRLINKDLSVDWDKLEELIDFTQV